MEWSRIGRTPSRWWMGVVVGIGYMVMTSQEGEKEMTRSVREGEPEWE